MKSKKKSFNWPNAKSWRRTCIGVYEFDLLENYDYESDRIKVQENISCAFGDYLHSKFIPIPVIEGFKLQKIFVTEKSKMYKIKPKCT